MIDRTSGVVHLLGNGRPDAAAVFAALTSTPPVAGRLTLSVGECVRVDAPTLAAVVAASRLLAARGIELRVEGLPAAAAALKRPPAERPAQASGQSKDGGLLAALGRRARVEWDDQRALWATVLDSTIDLFRLALRRTHMQRGSLVEQIVVMGTDGASIVALLAFLLGVILTFDTTVQLRHLGATSLAANVVGLSLFREFAPMLTAIVVIGRTGAAMASELASMTVDNEVSALKVMGISPTSFLITPRVVGIMLVQPVLTLLACLVGFAGAVASSPWSGGLGAAQFRDRLLQSVTLDDVQYAMTKGLAFATATGLISCAVGLNTRGAAAEVGRATTRAVVLSIFLFVVLDSFFAINSKAVLR